MSRLNLHTYFRNLQISAHFAVIIHFFKFHFEFSFQLRIEIVGHSQQLLLWDLFLFIETFADATAAPSRGSAILHSSNLHIDSSAIFRGVVFRNVGGRASSCIFSGFLRILEDSLGFFRILSVRFLRIINYLICILIRLPKFANFTNFTNFSNFSNFANFANFSNFTNFSNFANLSIFPILPIELDIFRILMDSWGFFQWDSWDSWELHDLHIDSSAPTAPRSGFQFLAFRFIWQRGRTRQPPSLITRSD